jgi:hypothetical protein
MSAPANCKLVGRWRIVKADIWDRDHLDLCGPATITITDHGRGEIAFGADPPGRAPTKWARSPAAARLLDDGSTEIEFAYHNGDEAVLKAKRGTSSTAC